MYKYCCTRRLVSRIFSFVQKRVVVPVVCRAARLTRSRGSRALSRFRSRTYEQQQQMKCSRCFCISYAEAKGVPDETRTTIIITIQVPVSNTRPQRRITDRWECVIIWAIVAAGY